MSGQEMEVTSVMLSLDLDPRVVRSLHECAESSGRSLDKIVEGILRQHLEVCCDGERQPISPSSLTWDALVPYARKLKIGIKFNLYDLMIRLHSHEGLSSLKISSAWHSAFAQWVRQHKEFEVERTAKGNLYVRISDEQAPLPARIKKVPFIDRMTMPELIAELKKLARVIPLKQEFTLDSLIANFPDDKLPKRISPAIGRAFRHWTLTTGAFRTYYKEHNGRSLVRAYERLTEITYEGKGAIK